MSRAQHQAEPSHDAAERAELLARLDARQVELDARKVADESALERPAETYRIVRREFAENPWDTSVQKRSGWYVVRWKVSCFGYSARQPFGQPGAYDLRDIATLRFLASREDEAVSFIEWIGVGAGDPFPSLDAAERWLRGWIDPLSESVPFDAKGDRLPVGGA